MSVPALSPPRSGARNWTYYVVLAGLAASLTACGNSTPAKVADGALASLADTMCRAGNNGTQIFSSATPVTPQAASALVRADGTPVGTQHLTAPLAVCVYSSPTGPSRFLLDSGGQHIDLTPAP